MHAHSYIRRAQEGANAWYLYVVGIILVIVGQLVGSIPFFLVQTARIAETGDASLATSMDTGLHPAINLALIVLPFIGSLVGLWAAMRFIHRRPFASLFNPSDRFNWEKAGFSIGLWMLFMILFESIAYLVHPENYTFAYDAGAFIPTMLVALLLLPFQTSLEELVFRGYLLQGFGLATRRPWISILFTSIMFGLLHIANPEISAFGSVILLYYIGFGVVMALITVMDESSELALGVHFANNFFGAMLVTFPSSALQTPALFTLHEYPVSLMTALWALASTLFIVIVAFRYKWSDWNRIWRKVQLDQSVAADTL